MLEIKNLNKSFKKQHVLNNVCLKIDDNEIFGFVGPNGAGKTTTMRIVAGLLVPDSGSVVYDGIDMVRNSEEIRKHIGFMPDFFGAYPNLKTYEYMEYFASLYGFVGNDIRKRCDELLDLVKLGDRKEAYVDNMSRGMKQRLCMARCLIHDPKLLILDEPVSGLDPRARFEMKEIMKILKGMRKTVIISSHILPELAEMTTTIGIIENGEIVTKGTIQEIMNSINRKERINIKVIEGKEKVVNILKADDKVDCLTIMNEVFSFIFDGDEKDAALLFREMFAQSALISEIKKDEGNLEEVFMEITKDE